MLLFLHFAVFATFLVGIESVCPLFPPPPVGCCKQLNVNVDGTNISLKRAGLWYSGLDYSKTYNLRVNIFGFFTASKVWLLTVKSNVSTTLYVNRDFSTCPEKLSSAWQRGRFNFFRQFVNDSDASLSFTCPDAEALNKSLAIIFSLLDTNGDNIISSQDFCIVDGEMAGCNITKEKFSTIATVLTESLDEIPSLFGTNIIISATALDETLKIIFVLLDTNGDNIIGSQDICAGEMAGRIITKEQFFTLGKTFHRLINENEDDFVSGNYADADEGGELDDAEFDI